MAKWTKTPSVLPNEVRDKFKYEIASDLGILDEIEQKGWADMPTRQLGRVGGKIGGNMVKVMIKYAEQSLAQGDKLE
ncbi:alpha/beta-type small acid-soluble spore protein [Sulfobacillus harzensis]|uniref:Alpha/beta-type small acid-soluble spore protein n=1 Tax=Sulfobacillus harzensis TaxID=2729629 RepID=A0A7Y0L311_9FIRM|nr:alpha/beta-type small acid-soluble spore protein [Sulfobacillus harzensis]NMP21806.1 alpha/beta-type small acid-soluble spore protein [Sulfobacillus harzensis]